MQQIAEQANNAITGKKVGTGPGLAKRIIGMHAGKIYRDVGWHAGAS